MNHAEFIMQLEFRMWLGFALSCQNERYGTSFHGESVFNSHRELKLPNQDLLDTQSPGISGGRI